MLLLLALSGAVAYGGTYTCYMSLGFWFYRRSSLALPMLSLSYLAQFPLSVYPSPMQFALTFVLPLGLATFYPVRALLGIATPQALVVIDAWMLPCLCLGAAAIGIAVFQAGLRRYVSSGT
jgi:ABC-2 type transport system permease protein